MDSTRSDSIDFSAATVLFLGGVNKAIIVDKDNYLAQVVRYIHPPSHKGSGLEICAFVGCENSADRRVTETQESCHLNLIGYGKGRRLLGQTDGLRA
jgi:hypothetical protein